MKKKATGVVAAVAPPKALFTKAGEVIGAATPAPAGGTPIGWSFYSTYQSCDRKWFIRYVLGVYPREPAEHLILGTCFHALMEGKSEAEIKTWGAAYQKQLPYAKKLYLARMKGPKMGKLVSAEETLTAPGSLKNVYTSKPDRIEEDGDTQKMFGAKVAKVESPRIVREFKTAATFRDTDDAKWQVNGEVIGELVTSGLKEAVVDITGKFDQPAVRQIQVLLTDLKVQRWEALVHDVISQVRSRLQALRGELNRTQPAPSFLEESNALIDRHFPAKLENCVSWSGQQCDYYNLCWASGPLVKAAFVKRNGLHDWAKRLDVRDLVLEILKFDVRKK